MRLVNITNVFRDIYLFIRDEKGVLETRKIKDFFPYFYEKDPNGSFKAYTGESLRKILVSSPTDIPKKRTINACEADILFAKRYLIDKVDKLEKTIIKYAFIDIEVLTTELPDVEKAKFPVSLLSVYNSERKTIKTFQLDKYASEYDMIKDFIRFMKEEKFDLWLSWNVKFDYNYLYNRFPDFAKDLSIIGQERYGDGQVYYPAGISIVDYLIWFKKITLNREKQYTLDYIAQKHLGDTANKKVDFSKITDDLIEKNKNDVRRMEKLERKFKLIDYFDEVRRLSKVEWEDMNWNSRVLDMLLLQEAKNQGVALPMKPAEERGTLSEKEDFEGAYREVFKSGHLKNIGVYDISGCYPTMIMDFCLDPANIDTSGVKNDMNYESIEIQKTMFEQNPNALLPTVVKKLVILKIDIKKKLSTLQDGTIEYTNLKKMYDAVKTIVNSAYGVFGNRFFRLYNKNVASATTYLAREVLKYTIEKLKEKGYEVVYVDTDGIMINNNTEDISNLLNEIVQNWAKEKFNKEKINVEFEYQGYFKSLILLTKCRYDAIKDNGERETKGVESKRKDSTKFMVDFQTTLFDKIHAETPKEEIFSWIKQQMKEIKHAPLQDISFPCRLAKDPDKYKNKPIFVRAVENTPEFETKIGNSFYYVYVKPQGYDIKKVDQEVIMTYGKDGEEKGFKNLTLNRLNKAVDAIDVEDRIKELNEDERLDKLEKLKLYKHITIEKKGKPKDVLAFNEEIQDHIHRGYIDWYRIIDRNITMKLATIFEAMKWDVKEVIND